MDAAPSGVKRRAPPPPPPASASHNSSTHSHAPSQSSFTPSPSSALSSSSTSSSASSISTTPPTSTPSSPSSQPQYQSGSGSFPAPYPRNIPGRPSFPPPPPPPMPSSSTGRLPPPPPPSATAFSHTREHRDNSIASQSSTHHGSVSYERTSLSSTPPASAAFTTSSSASALPSSPPSSSSTSSSSSNGPTEPPPKPPRHSRSVSAQLQNEAIAVSASLMQSAAAAGSDENKLATKQQLETIEYYFRQALQASNISALRDLLSKATELHLTGELVEQAADLVREKDSETTTTELNTLKFYLKQGIENKNKDVLKLALEKVEPVLIGITPLNRRLYADFFQLVDEAKKVLSGLDKENANTINFYLKQGIQLRSREVLKEAIDKASAVLTAAAAPLTPSSTTTPAFFNSSSSSSTSSVSVASPSVIDKELLNQAKDTLSELDAQHMIRGYVRAAISARDDVALENALNQAYKLKIPATDGDMVEATRLLADLRAKLKKDQKVKAPPKKWFGMSSSNLNGPSSVSSSSSSSPSSSSSSRKGREKLFGSPLEEAVRKHAGEVAGIPKVMSHCITFLRANALQEPGLFRVPGNKDSMEGIQFQFENDYDVVFDDVHDAAGVLKQYLRTLPEPLIPFEHYASFIKAGNIKGNDNEDRKKALKDLVESLPQDFRGVLTYLISFLVDVSQHSAVNKMTPDNLAIVFAPNLIRPKVETPNSMMVETPVAISVIATLISHYHTIFNVPYSAPSAAPSSSSSSPTSNPVTPTSLSSASISTSSLPSTNGTATKPKG